MVTEFTNAVMVKGAGSIEQHTGGSGVGGLVDFPFPSLELSDLLNSLVTMLGQRRAATIIRSICGIAGQRHGSPSLQRLVVTD